MTCRLTACSQIPHFANYFCYLFPDSPLNTKYNLDIVEDDESENVTGWDCEWEWDDVALRSKNQSTHRKESVSTPRSENATKCGHRDSCTIDQLSQAVEECFQKVLISMSPLGDVIVMAHETRVVILAQKYNSSMGTKSKVKESSNIDATSVHHNEYEFEEVYHGQPHHFHDDSTIKAIRCVPLASLRRSSCGTPDWTCVILGFANGYVRFYSVENGGEILSQRFHDGAVQQIKMRSVELSSPDGTDEHQVEELTVLYDNILISIDGFSLFQTLRACRSQLARASATEDGQAGLLVSPLLTFKKWKLSGQNAILDHSCAGNYTPCAFDRLVHKSSTEGPLGRISPKRPTYTRYVVAGKEPCVCFYQANEEGVSLGISDIASVVASKMKNALLSATGLGSWFGGSAATSPTEASPQQQQQLVDKAALEQTAITLASMFGLSDKLRIGFSVEVSPDLRLAAVTDLLGRVILLDVASGLAIRMWKGYREAQVQFIQRHEPTSSGKAKTPNMPKRCVTYLCIYSPRRKILEVFALRQGLRVAAFNVPSCSRLVSTNYHMAGRNMDIAIPESWHSGTTQCHPFYLVDPSGTISVVDVPFHLALTNVNSHRACDYDSLRFMRSLFHQYSEECEKLFDDCCEIFNKLRLVPSLEMAMAKLFTIKYLSGEFISRILQHIIMQLENDCICSHSSINERTRILTFTQTYLTLINTFNCLSSVLSTPLATQSSRKCGDIEENNDMKDSILDSQTLAALTSSNVDDADRYLELFRSYHALNESSSSMDSLGEVDVAQRLLFSHEITPLEFLDWFTCSPQGSVEQNTFRIEIHLTSKMTTKPHLYALVGRFFFQAYIERAINLKSLQEILEKSQISSVLLLKVFTYWFLSEDRPQIQKVSRMKSLLCELFTSILNSPDFFYYPQLPLDVTPASPRHTSGERDSPTLMNAHSHEDSEKHHKNSGKVLPISMILTECLVITSRSQHLLAGLQLALVIPALVEEFLGKDKEKDSSSEKSSFSVVHDEQLSLWLILRIRVEHLLWFRLLLLHSPMKLCNSDKRSSNNENVVIPASQEFKGVQEISVSKVQESGIGFLQELFARWTVCHSMEPGELEQLYRSLGRGLVDSDSRFVSTDADERPSIVTKIFKRVYENFPHTLEYDSVLANAAWENLVAWTKAHECTDYLQRSIDCLSRTGPAGAMVVLGVQSMMWEMHLKKPIQNITYALQRCDSLLPTRMEWKREADMSEDALEHFLNILVLFMKLFIRSHQRAEVVPSFGRDTHWLEASENGRLSLVEYAVSRPTPVLELLQHHLQLLLLIAASFRLRISKPVMKPLTVFDNLGIQCLFGSLSSSQLPPIPSFVKSTDDREANANAIVDFQVERRREPFLKRIVECSVSRLATSSAVEQGECYKQCLDATLMLAEMWKLSTDELNIHHVVQLFTWGLDDQGNLYLQSVKDQANMAVRLFRIVEQRLSFLCCEAKGRPVALKYRAFMTPTLSAVIENGYPSKFHAKQNTNFDTIRSLVHVLLHRLPHEAREYKLVLWVEEFLCRIEDNE